jgi:hypothetical protein
MSYCQGCADLERELSASRLIIVGFNRAQDCIATLTAELQAANQAKEAAEAYVAALAEAAQAVIAYFETHDGEVLRWKTTNIEIRLPLVNTICAYKILLNALSASPSVLVERARANAEALRNIHSLCVVITQSDSRLCEATRRDVNRIGELARDALRAAEEQTHA